MKLKECENMQMLYFSETSEWGVNELDTIINHILFTITQHETMHT